MQEVASVEQQLMMLIQNVPAVVFKGYMDGTVDLCDDKVEAVTGYARQEFDSRRMKWTDLIVEEDWEDARKKFIEALRSKAPYVREYRIRREDGRIVWIQERGYMVSGSTGRIDYVSGLFFDITERVRTEEALGESERYYRSLLFSMHEDVLVIDPRYTIRDVNKDFLVTIGKMREEVIGRACHEVTRGYPKPCRFHGETCTLQEVFQTGEARNVRQEHIREDGSKIVVDALFSPLRDNAGRITHVIKAIRDVTVETELERRLRQSQKMEAIGTLAGGIAHDFNNILAGVLGFSELGLRGLPKSHRVHYYLEQILASGYRARDLVKQILAFSRSTESRMAPLHVGSVIKEALKLLRGSIPKNVEIETAIDTENDSILADPVQIHQILMNLCANAWQAIKEGSGVVRIELDEISAGKENGIKPGPCLEIKVSDTGCGMSPRTMERIFEPYFTTRERGEGTGLGLSVVLGIVKRQGGAISVESEPGRGTVFRVLFPLIDSSPETPSIYQEPLRGKGRILLVDDEPAITEIGQASLEYLGYEVVSISSGMDAVEAFRAEPQSFDLVITDLTMPGLCGRDLAREVQRVRPDMPVILCTGFSEQITREKAKELGIREVLSKPVAVCELAQAVHRAMGLAEE